VLSVDFPLRYAKKSMEPSKIHNLSVPLLLNLCKIFLAQKYLHNRYCVHKTTLSIIYFFYMRNNHSNIPICIYQIMPIVKFYAFCRLLNGNQLSGFLPDEIGNLQNLNRLQIDQNQILGPIPKSFANLRNMKHLHMNNNSLSGQIPSELWRIPLLLHLLVDNNNLSGPLPIELAKAPALKILYVPH